MEDVQKEFTRFPRKHPKTTPLHDRWFPRIFGIFFRDTCYGKVMFHEVSVEIFQKLPENKFNRETVLSD